MKDSDFEAQLPRLYPKLTSMARYLRCRDVEDIVQQTLEETWRSVETLEGNILPYARRILMRKNIKARKQPVCLPLIDAVTGVAIDVAMPPRQEAVVLTRALGGMIEALATEFRDVLLLVGVEGHSLKDVAAALGLPLGTVKSRLYRAKAIMKVQLMDQDQAQPSSVGGSHHEAASQSAASPTPGHHRPVGSGQSPKMAADQISEDGDIWLLKGTLNPVLWKKLQRYLRSAEEAFPRAVWGCHQMALRKAITESKFSCGKLSADSAAEACVILAQ